MSLTSFDYRKFYAFKEPFHRFVYNKALYYTLPLFAIIILSYMTNFFYAKEKIINKEYLWDSARPYNIFLYEMNLPNLVGAVLVSGTPDNVTKTEKYYAKHEIGNILFNQLLSLLFGIKITVFSQAYSINFLFGIFSMFFSILAGYLIFKNGYISIIIFLLIVIFRNSCQGLIYGLPLRHLYAVFNPLIAFCFFIFILMFFKNGSKKYIFIFAGFGFIAAFIGYIRTSEGMIITYSIVVFTLILLAQYLLTYKKGAKRAFKAIIIIFVSIYAGYLGFYGMVKAFEYHRDKKFNFPPNEEMVLEHPPFHNLYMALFRFDTPNKYSDWLSYNAVFERYPEIKNKYITDSDNPAGSVVDADGTVVDLTKMTFFSIKYYEAIKEVCIEFILKHPKHVSIYIVKSIYDYMLFLPYYSWTGNKSAHAHLPIIEKSAKIAPQDFAPGYGNKLLLNLRLKYLPKNLLFWVYFVFAYTLLIEAIYTSFIQIKKGSIGALINKVGKNKLPIYMLQGMLIYFLFVSIVRILIPAHGQGAVVAFNIIVIYNFARLIFTQLRVNESN